MLLSALTSWMGRVFYFRRWLFLAQTCGVGFESKALCSSTASTPLDGDQERLWTSPQTHQRITLLLWSLRDSDVTSSADQCPRFCSRSPMFLRACGGLRWNGARSQHRLMSVSTRERRLTTLPHHVKCNSVFWHDFSQRECVGRVIKCARQSCDKGNKCAGA